MRSSVLSNLIFCILCCCSEHSFLQCLGYSVFLRYIAHGTFLIDEVGYAQMWSPLWRGLGTWYSFPPVRQYPYPKADAYLASWTLPKCLCRVLVSSFLANLFSGGLIYLYMLNAFVCRSAYYVACENPLLFMCVLLTEKSGFNCSYSYM